MGVGVRGTCGKRGNIGYAKRNLIERISASHIQLIETSLSRMCCWPLRLLSAGTRSALISDSQMSVNVSPTRAGSRLKNCPVMSQLSDHQKGHQGSSEMSH